MSEKRRRFPWAMIPLLSGALLISFVVVSILWFFLSFAHSIRQVKKLERTMQTAETYMEIGHSLAVYCQTGPSIFPTGAVGNAWLPKSVRNFNPTFVNISETNAHVAMGGGFHHFGYFLTQNAVTGESNSWTLGFYSEGSETKQLTTFTTARREKVLISEFVTNAISEYARLASTKQDEIYALRVQQNRIAFLIQFGRLKVRDACLQAINEMPTHWWPRLTLAVIDSAQRGYSDAGAAFETWVKSSPSYSRYIYLAYFYQLVDKPKDAALAMDKAVKYPIVDLQDDHMNTECRGYSAAVYAFRTGHYSTIISLCDALLPVTANGDYAKAALRELKRSAVSARSGEAPTFIPDAGILGFNPYENVSLEALRTL